MKDDTLDTGERYDVVLEDPGLHRFSVIDELVIETGRTRDAANELLRQLPAVALSEAKLGQAVRLREHLEMLGARVTVRERTAAPAGERPALLVRLRSMGTNKINTIKAVRSFIALGLKETKELVESAPCVVARGLDPEAAQALLEALVSAGASASIEVDDQDPPVAATTVHATGQLAAEHDVILRSPGPAKIPVIKELRTALGLGLKEAKNLCDAAPSVIANALEPAVARDLASRLVAVGAVVEVRPPLPGVGASAVERSWQVVLEVIGPKKINVIKVARAATGLGLKDTKELVESAPCVIARGLSTAAAQALRDELLAAHAQARVDAVTVEAPTQVATYRLLLDSFGAKKIMTIKAVRTILPGLGLRVVKELVESAPCEVASGLERDAARRALHELTEAGAHARLEEER
ncbi:MAG: ribosomal protein L7/L12 [Myxococcales bacterium]|nr:ribosomal protein L7/L12 [Myxococcales bacterium]